MAAGDLPRFRCMPDLPEQAANEAFAGADDGAARDALVAEIVDGWRQRLRGSPDLQPREGLRGQRERALARALLAAAEVHVEGSVGREEDEEAFRKLAMAAALYGADMPRDRLDPGALCEELGHLRQEVWHHLRQANLEREVVTERILSFDRALTIALRAALTGGFRCEPESVPGWPGALDTLGPNDTPRAVDQSLSAPPVDDGGTSEGGGPAAHVEDGTSDNRDNPDADPR